MTMTLSDTLTREMTFLRKLEGFRGNLRDIRDNEELTPEEAQHVNATIDCINDILMLYRNIVQLWGAVQDGEKRLSGKIEKIASDLEEAKKELNAKIDEVNNYLINLYTLLAARVSIIEEDLRTMTRVYICALERENDGWALTHSGENVTFEQCTAWNTKDLVIVRGMLNGEYTYLYMREYDVNDPEGLFEWYTTGLVGDEIHEITCTLLPDNSVNVATEIKPLAVYESGFGISIDEDKVISVDTDVIQEKLTAGDNITIDNNVISAAGVYYLTYELDPVTREPVLLYKGERVSEFYALRNEATAKNQPIYLCDKRFGIYTRVYTYVLYDGFNSFFQSNIGLFAQEGVVTKAILYMADITAGSTVTFSEIELAVPTV